MRPGSSRPTGRQIPPACSSRSTGRIRRGLRGAGIREFMARYPKIEVELQASDRQADFFAQGLDLRCGSANCPMSHAGTQLGRNRVVVFGRLPISRSIPARCLPTILFSHQCIVRILEGSDRPGRFGSTDDANWSRSKDAFAPTAPLQSTLPLPQGLA